MPLDGEARLVRMLSSPGPIRTFRLAPNNMFLTAIAIDAEGKTLQTSGDGAWVRRPVATCSATSSGSSWGCWPRPPAGGCRFPSRMVRSYWGSAEWSAVIRPLTVRIG